MSKARLTTIIVFVVLLFVVHFVGIDSIVSFVLVGAIPDSTISVPPAIMLLIMLLSIWFLVFRLTAIRVLHAVITNQLGKRAR